MAAFSEERSIVNENNMLNYMLGVRHYRFPVRRNWTISEGFLIRKSSSGKSCIPITLKQLWFFSKFPKLELLSILETDIWRYFLIISYILIKSLSIKFTFTTMRIGSYKFSRTFDLHSVIIVIPIRYVADCEYIS